MAEIRTFLQHRIESLVYDRRLYREKFGELDRRNKNDNNWHPPLDDIRISRLWLRAERSHDKYRDLLIEYEQDRTTKIDGLTRDLVQLTMNSERDVQLAQVQKDEKVRLAEIAKEEKDRMAVIAKEEKCRLAEIAADEKIRLAQLAKEEKDRLATLASDEKIRLQKLANEEKVRMEELSKEKRQLAMDEREKLALVAKDEKIRLAEIAESENVSLTKLTTEEKTRLKELEKDIQEIQKDEKCKLREMAKEECMKANEQRLEEVKCITEAQRELAPRVIELETLIKQANTKKDELVAQLDTSERKTRAIFQHVERLFRANGSNNDISLESTPETAATSTISTPVISKGSSLPGSELDDILDRVERTLQFTKRLSTLLDNGCAAVNTYSAETDASGCEETEASSLMDSD
ncbi:MAG: hypothetical protein J3Q66DRAFT_343874 [Benniella sp.]|nr:MAG: hypothetical protein J3Q66DRAFT_343874 [Benniella sp.]